MNRRKFLGLAVLAPAVAPALVKTLGAAKPFNLEALKAATTRVLAPMAEQMEMVTVVETWTRTKENGWWLHTTRYGDDVEGTETYLEKLPFVFLDNPTPNWISQKTEVPRLMLTNREKTA